MVQARLVDHPALLHTPPQDEDPTPVFPDEHPCGSGSSVPDLGCRIVSSMARLERRIDTLVDLLSSNTASPCQVSNWSQGIDEVFQRSCNRHVSPADGAAASMHSSNNAVASRKSVNDHTSQTVCGNVMVNMTHGEDQHVVQNSVQSNERQIANGVSHESQAYESTASSRYDDDDDMSRPRTIGSIRSDSFIQNLYNGTKASQEKIGVCAQLLVSGQFDVFISTLVIVNALMLGVQVNLEVENKPPIMGFKYFEWVCTAIFIAELLLRFWATGLRRMFTRKERLMSTMDILLVIVAVMDTVLDILVTSGSTVNTSASMARLIKVLRIGRLLRPLRTVAYLSELRVIAAMIAGSFRSLFWLSCILVALTYCFSLVLTQGVASYFKDLAQSDNIPEEYDEIKSAFGSVLVTMYSLVLSMTGGRSWGEFSGLISNAGIFYGGMIMGFVFVNLFSVLNIVTGVFVEGAIELAKRDRSIMIDKQNKNKQASLQHLVSLLSQLDTDGDGIISRDEFFEAIARPDAQNFMDALGIDPNNAAEIFLLLDKDGDGIVELKEFIGGMERIRGEAKSIDIQMLRLYTQKITDEVACIRGMPSSLLTGVHVDRCDESKDSPAESMESPIIQQIARSLTAP